jgi:CheY-like chemotaxis protein
MTEAESIMMIEDDDGHARLIEKHIRRSGLNSPIRRFADGTSALDHLFQRSKVPGEAKPALILLDLNLPDISGIDILTRIKGDPTIRLTPVIVLTTTDDRLEIRRCYDLGCNVYVTKPVGDQGFAQVIQQVGQLMSIMQTPEPS